jgi:hypothetical protein
MAALPARRVGGWRDENLKPHLAKQAKIYSDFLRSAISFRKMPISRMLHIPIIL